MPRKNYPLRVGPELYAALGRWAADELRSVNAQIEYLLTQSVREAGRLKPGSHPASPKDREEA